MSTVCFVIRNAIHSPACSGKAVLSAASTLVNAALEAQQTPSSPIEHARLRFAVDLNALLSICACRRSIVGRRRTVCRARARCRHRGASLRSCLSASSVCSVLFCGLSVCLRMTYVFVCDAFRPSRERRPQLPTNRWNCLTLACKFFVNGFEVCRHLTVFIILFRCARLVVRSLRTVARCARSRRCCAKHREISRSVRCERQPEGNNNGPKKHK